MMSKALILLATLVHIVEPIKVLVTGAAGRTGSLVLTQLVKEDDIEPRALVRTPKSGKKLLNKLNNKLLGKSDPKLDEDALIAADVTSSASIEQACADCEVMIVATSAVPKPQIFSLLSFLVKKSLRFRDPGSMQFSWSTGTPEDVDWIGQRNQFDAAKKAGIKHIILVSSMGGTQDDNMLNNIGKGNNGEPGNILAWKRKAEMYLIESGLTYTIVHPGGLKDEPGFKRQLKMGVDDEILKSKERAIPREDVARVCVHAIKSPKYHNRSFDLSSYDEGNGAATEDLDQLIDSLEGKNCDYGLTPALL